MPEKTHGLLQKIQAMYFKIQGTYFKISALYFLRFQEPETQCLLNVRFLRFCTGKNGEPAGGYAFSFVRGISIISRSLNGPLSAVNLTSVRTVCHPCKPAAPGFIWSSPSRLSYSTFRIWECPLMKSLGGRRIICSLMLRS